MKGMIMNKESSAGKKGRYNVFFGDNLESMILWRYKNKSGPMQQTNGRSALAKNK
jgi:hypothetical protein